jgi:hypothetical protein
MSVNPDTSAQLWHQVKAPKWEPARTAWLLTCVDLTSLLVGFFVLLFSTKTLDTNSWQAMTGSLQAAFAPRIAAVAVVPDGMPNALVVAPGVRSGLGYLDTLLHQRLEADPVWGSLMAQSKSAGQSEMTYLLPDEVLDPAQPNAVAAWRRLAVAVRGWKNPIEVRANVVADSDLAAAMARSVALAGILAAAGGADVSAEVRKAEHQSFQLVVRAQ